MICAYYIFCIYCERYVCCFFKHNCISIMHTQVVQSYADIGVSVDFNSYWCSQLCVELRYRCILSICNRWSSPKSFGETSHPFLGVGSPAWRSQIISIWWLLRILSFTCLWAGFAKLVMFLISVRCFSSFTWEVLAELLLLAFPLFLQLKCDRGKEARLVHSSMGVSCSNSNTW